MPRKKLKMTKAAIASRRYYRKNKARIKRKRKAPARGRRKRRCRKR